MCTAISVTVKDNYFGRNLDYEHGFGEKITITPRKYGFSFKNGEVTDSHYAIIGMALPHNNYPLYFDATNEKGLSMAGLNFPDNAEYMKRAEGRENIGSYEFIPWILTKCANVSEAESLIENANIIDHAFDESLRTSPLHWLIADRDRAITVEQTEAGLKMYNNPTGVLTNNPPFDFQLQNLANYMSVTSAEPKNMFSDKLYLKPYSQGMGGLGLPGDWSSVSRFVRTCFVRQNLVFGNTEQEIINQFFHILYSVYQQRGCVKVGDGFEITNYTSCCNTSRGIYYYTTYNNSNINAVDMHREDLNDKELVVYDLITEQESCIRNK